VLFRSHNLSFQPNQNIKMSKSNTKCAACGKLFDNKGALQNHLDAFPDHKRATSKKPSLPKQTQHALAVLGKENHFNTKVNVSKVKNVVKTVVTEDVQKLTHKENQKLVFSLVQDVSGSMAGSPIDHSIAAIGLLFDHIFRPDDFLGVVMYNDSVTRLHAPMPVKSVNRDKDMVAIRRAVSGRTATYDALGSAVADLHGMKVNENYNAVTENAVYQMLLITDGDDNSSVNFTLDTISELIAKPGLPHFHLFVIAVKMKELDKKKLKKLCQPDHCTFYEIEELEKLAEVMRRVGQRVTEKIVRTTTKEVTVSTVSHVVAESPRKTHSSAATSTSVSALSSPPEVVERNLVKIFKKRSHGILGSQVHLVYEEEYHFPLDLGGRKLKAVLQDTGQVVVKGDEAAAGDKLFIHRAHLR